MKFEQEELKDGPIIDSHLLISADAVHEMMVDYDCFTGRLAINRFPNLPGNLVADIISKLLKDYSDIGEEVTILAFHLKYGVDGIMSENFARLSIFMENGLSALESLELTPLGKAALQLGFSKISTPIVNKLDAHVKFSKPSDK